MRAHMCLLRDGVSGEDIRGEGGCDLIVWTCIESDISGMMMMMMTRHEGKSIRRSLATETFMSGHMAMKGKENLGN